MALKAVFLDGAGVLFDQDRLPAEWDRLVALSLPPQLGGEPAKWSAANRTALARAGKRVIDKIRADGSGKGARAFVAEERVRWLTEMCAEVGVAPPTDVASLAEDAISWCASNVKAGLRDVASELRVLKDAGVTLFTATSVDSIQMGGYLRALGVRDLVDRTYGPDLVDRWKSGAHFYHAICEDARVAPADALVVDDQAVCLEWARAAGCSTVLLTTGGDTWGRATVASLSELPALVG